MCKIRHSRAVIWTRLGRLFSVDYVFGHTPPFPLVGAFWGYNEFASLNSRHSWVFIPRRISNPQISDATDAYFIHRTTTRGNSAKWRFWLISPCLSELLYFKLCRQTHRQSSGKANWYKHYIILTTVLQPSSRVHNMFPHCAKTV